MQIKWKEFIIGLDIVDSLNQFEITTSTYKKIVNAIYASEHSPLLRNRALCMRFQEDFWLYERNKTQHKILGYDISRERNFESSLTLQ
jgi:hypothetical protein